MLLVCFPPFYLFAFVRAASCVCFLVVCCACVGFVFSLFCLFSYVLSLCILGSLKCVCVYLCSVFYVICSGASSTVLFVDITMCGLCVCIVVLLHWLLLCFYSVALCFSLACFGLACFFVGLVFVGLFSLFCFC